MINDNNKIVDEATAYVFSILGYLIPYHDLIKQLSIKDSYSDKDVVSLKAYLQSLDTMVFQCKRIAKVLLKEDKLKSFTNKPPFDDLFNGKGVDN